jgi:hypothetical protein
LYFFLLFSSLLFSVVTVTRNVTRYVTRNATVTVLAVSTLPIGGSSVLSWRVVVAEIRERNALRSLVWDGPANRCHCLTKTRHTGNLVDVFEVATGQDSTRCVLVCAAPHAQ